ncbi:DUF1963 domain-containing protein [Streptomyces sp. NBC_01506]|uniref:DUF1963 domain-containing protein n=1 Tax=Streptomyces sp. NBC_01506 TaxID=2903887 RepID=UPI0038683EA3
MMFDDPAALHRECAARLGEKTGPRFAAMSRRGFRLTDPADAAPATGRCRLGGPALLEPGTSWPEFAGLPLSLHAVLDTDALAPWLGEELPTRPGLLNFFYFDADIPFDEYQNLDMTLPGAGRVIAADPARAVETTAPRPARSYPATPVHAAEVTMLPDCWDIEDDDIDFDRDEHWGATSLILTAMDGLDSNTAGHHCAFGWPDTSYATWVTDRDDDGPAIHLLQLPEDPRLGWGDAGTMYFTIPAGDFAAGDFTTADADMRCC